MGAVTASGDRDNIDDDIQSPPIHSIEAEEKGLNENDDTKDDDINIEENETAQTPMSDHKEMDLVKSIENVAINTTISDQIKNENAPSIEEKEENKDQENEHDEIKDDDTMHEPPQNGMSDHKQMDTFIVNDDDDNNQKQQNAEKQTSEIIASDKDNNDAFDTNSIQTLDINEEYKKKHWTSQRLTTLDIFSTDTETKQVVSAQNEELKSPDLVLDKTNNDGMDNEKMEETNILIS